MSTIEEAREQAREALATLDQELLEWLLGERSWVDQHHGRPDEIEMTARADRATIQLLTTRQAALRALLDATEQPAKDEREALVMTLYANGMAGNLHEPIRRQAVEKWADAILANGDSKGLRPITDEMVAAADFAIMPYWGERYPSGSLTTEIARAALEAAEAARR